MFHRLIPLRSRGHNTQCSLVATCFVQVMDVDIGILGQNSQECIVLHCKYNPLPLASWWYSHDCTCHPIMCIVFWSMHTQGWCQWQHGHGQRSLWAAGPGQLHRTVFNSRQPIGGQVFETKVCSILTYTTCMANYNMYIVLLSCIYVTLVCMYMYSNLHDAGWQCTLRQEYSWLRVILFCRSMWSII